MGTVSGRSHVRLPQLPEQIVAHLVQLPSRLVVVDGIGRRVQLREVDPREQIGLHRRLRIEPLVGCTTTVGPVADSGDS